MWHFITSHLADIFMALSGIFAGAAIIVLEVAIGSVIEKDIFPVCCIPSSSWLLTPSFWQFSHSNKKSPRRSGGFVTVLCGTLRRSGRQWQERHQQWYTCRHCSGTQSHRKENRG
jgi:hypothetical protein